MTNTVIDKAPHLEIASQGDWRTSPLRFWGRGIPACAGFGASLLFCMARLARNGDRSVVASETARVMSRLVCTPLGIRVRVLGAEYLDVGRPAIFVANHQSFLDYPILGRIFPAHTAIVGKSEMGSIPLIGSLFRATGNVLIERRSAESAARTLVMLGERVRSGTSVWLFPEGTRNNGEAPLLPFRSGAFRLSAATGAPIVPVVVSPLAPKLDIRRRRLEPCTVTLSILPPHLPNGEEPQEIRALMDTVRSSMLQCVVTQSWAE